VFTLVAEPSTVSTFVDKLGTLRAETVVRWTWLVAQWPLVVAGLLLCFATLLYLGPNVEHRKWSFFTIGAAVAVAGWVLASAAFSFYSSRFGSYNKTCGALASVVILLTWLWLSALSLLFAAEVNAEVERSRELRRGEPAEAELQAPAKA
jgi:membrane protein